MSTTGQIQTTGHLLNRCKISNGVREGYSGIIMVFLKLLDSLAP
jgi:hypothetical protein